MKQTQQNWLLTEYADHYLQSEAAHIASATRQIRGPNSMQIGNTISPEIQSQLDFPLQICVASCIEDLDGVDVNKAIPIIADAAFLPIADNTISSLFLPHVLETNKLPHQVLREVNRVLAAEGWLVLTGFNPFSLLGLQSLIYHRSVLRGRYYSVNRSKDWLQLLGFDVVASSMFQYSPLSRSKRVRKATRFIEAVGDRWLPMFGGGYMILAKKRDEGMTFVGKTVKTKLKRPKLISATAGKVISFAAHQNHNKSNHETNR